MQNQRRITPPSHWLATCLLAAAMPASAPADVYKWIDDAGQTHFAEHPPVGVAAQRVGGTSGVDSPAAVKAMQDAEQGFKARQAAAAKQQADADAKAAKAEAKRKACEQARATVDRMGSTQRVYEGEGDNRHRLSAEEIQARIRTAQEAAAKNCDA